jgi:hypothetical protein
VLHEHGVKSAACYEMFGPHDLLLRVWLPPASVELFRSDLVRQLGHGHADMCDPFVVRRPLRHWLFPRNATGMLLSPEPEAIETLTIADIRAVEGDERSEALRDRLREQHLLADFLAAPETTDPANPGTKFAVVVTGNTDLRISQRDHFEDSLVSILDGATRIGQPSLYSGDGFGHFLILGQLKNQPVYVLNDELLTAIANAHIQRLYNARTFTHVSGQRDFVFLYESLIDVIPATPPEPEPDAIAVRNLRAHPRSPLPSIESGPPVIGKVFADRYEVRSEIGEGGFSVVFEVFDLVEQEPRALKLFQTGNAYDHVSRELRFLRKVQHRNVLRVYWADRTFDGLWFLITELVEGVLLEEYVRGGERLTQEEALRVVDEILIALKAIHPDEERIRALKTGEMSQEQFAELQELQDAGFVHRDVKPSNVFLTPRGVKLLDFNIASRAGDPRHTQAGTPPYQAPDESLGAWDVSTDLFAVGVILFELLCDGGHPYPGRNPQCGEEPRDPREFDPDMAPQLAELLLRACAPLASERFASATEMRAALAPLRTAG